MATVVNFIDTALQAAAARSVNLPTADIQLLPSAPLFKVAPDGSITPESITFTATLIDLEADLTFNATGAPLTSPTARSVTVVGESLTGSSVTVIASATVNGRTYTKPCTVSKVQDGSVGSTTYTWIKYADSAAGAGLSDSPAGKAYIGLAYNKPSPIESTVASDYTWSLIKGTDGQPGPPGADGVQLYTWIKYADYATGDGMYELPTENTLYIGIAVNKLTPTESSNPADYVWSRFKGDQGVPGPALYTWIKYADSAAGAGLSDDPTGKAYIGFAYNKTTAVESENPADYTWSLNQGGQGVPGQPGKDGQTLYTWIKYADAPDGTGLYDVPNASTTYIGIAVNKVIATESTNKADYAWSKFRGDQGVPGNPGQPGQRGTVDISAGTAGTVWSDSEATAAIAQTGYGVPQMLDVVTLYNQAAGFASTRYWNGSAWIPVSQVINGALLVKGTVAAEAVDTRGLAVKDLQGKVIVGIGSALDPAYAAPGTLNSGVSLSSTGQLFGAGGGQVQTLPVVDGARNVDYAPRDYGIVHVKEFKATAAIGVPTAIGYCTLETMKPWADNSGGFATQWAYVKDDEIWKRSGGCGDASWGPWVRDLDRSVYTGDLNASYGADTNNLNVGLGRANLLEANTLPSDLSTFSAGFSVGGGSGPFLAKSTDDIAVYSPGGRGCVWIKVDGFPAAGTTADIYRNDRVKVVAGQRYEFGVTLSTHRCTARVGVAWEDVNGVYITEHGGSDVTNSAWRNDSSASAPPRSTLLVTAPAGARRAMVFVRQVHTGAESPYTFASQWYAGEALPSQVVPSPYSANSLEARDIAVAAQAGLADKLSQTAGGILQGQVTLQTSGAIVAGNASWGSAGYGGTGTVQSPYGFACVQNGVPRLAMSVSGDIFYSGELRGAYGTFNVVRVNGALVNGGFTEQYVWAPKGQGGFHLSGSGFIMGDHYNHKWFQITWDGNVYSERFRIVDGQVFMDGPTINNPSISTEFYASIADVYMTGQSGTVTIDIYPTFGNGSGNYSYQWVLTSNGPAFTQLTGAGENHIRFQITGGTNAWRQGSVSVFVKDLTTGATSLAECSINVGFGNAVPP